MNISEIFIRRPDCHNAAHGRAPPVRTGLPTNCCRSPRCPTSISRPSSSPRNCRAQVPTHMAATVATPLEDQFTAIPGLSQMTSTSGLGQTTDHAAVRSEPQYRRRRRQTCRRRSMRQAGCCRRTCRTRRPIARPTRPTDRSSSTPCIRTQCRSTSSTPTPTRSWRSRCRRCRALAK